MTCDTFTTDAFFKPLARAGIRTFPGAFARMRLDVMTAATTVCILLRLNSLDWMIRTGRRKPGVDPLGIARQAHQISPRCTTSALQSKRLLAVLQYHSPNATGPDLSYKQRPVALLRRYSGASLLRHLQLANIIGSWIHPGAWRAFLPIEKSGLV